LPSLRSLFSDRLLAYIGLLYQDILDSKQLLANGKLPPVLPLVLYNGKSPWSAALEISELIETIPGGLENATGRNCATW
jgi:Putative transposase, YhgA-like